MRMPPFQGSVVEDLPPSGETEWPAVRVKVSRPILDDGWRVERSSRSIIRIHPKNLFPPEPEQGFPLGVIRGFP